MKLLMTHELISDFDDIFDLTKDELLGLEGFEETKANNLIKAIATAHQVSFDRFLIGLGIPHVGGETAILLAERFPTLPTLLRGASEEALSMVEGIGPVIGDAVHTWFAQEENQALLMRLEKHLKIMKVIAPKKGPLTGQVIVITGTLPTLSREEAEARVRRAGGKPASSVSSKTSFVVAGENSGSKYEKAQELGIPVVGEADFLKKLGA